MHYTLPMNAMFMMLGAAIGGTATVGFTSPILGPWAVLAIFPGVLVGAWIGRLPMLVALSLARRSLRRSSAEVLRQQLDGPVWPWFHEVFREFYRRGEDLDQYADVGLRLLYSHDAAKQSHGRVILYICAVQHADFLDEQRPAPPSRRDG